MEVHMKIFDIGLASHFDKLLSLRERELCAVLGARDALAMVAGDDGRGVTDFKDMAVEQSLAAVDEAQAEQAGHELEQVLAARRRLKDHVYGNCLDCGQEIGLGRLAAMPATSYCTECQAVHEPMARGGSRRTQKLPLTF
jgi:DnaK suppressor protein